MADHFADWVTYHAERFGMNNDAEIATMLTWRHLFAVAGYSRRELEAATDWMVANAFSLAVGDARFMGKAASHLAAIQGRVREARAVVYRKEADQWEHDLGTCTICGGSGRVVVPHWKGIKDGQWVPVKSSRSIVTYYTMAVTCRCALGRWVENHISDPKKRPLTLERYEAWNPKWREQLYQRQRQHMAEGDLLPVDQKYDAALRRLAEGLRMPGDDDE